jgi:hypothetical protein
MNNYSLKNLQKKRIKDQSKQFKEENIIYVQINFYLKDEICILQVGFYTALKYKIFVGLTPWIKNEIEFVLLFLKKLCKPLLPYLNNFKPTTEKTE